MDKMDTKQATEAKGGQEAQAAEAKGVQDGLCCRSKNMVQARKRTKGALRGFRLRLIFVLFSPDSFQEADAAVDWSRL
jgi:hypothetical protein